jgi:hypothetical protein
MDVNERCIYGFIIMGLWYAEKRLDENPIVNGWE